MARLLPYWVRRYQRQFICRLLAFSVTGTLLCLFLLPRTVHSIHIAEDVATGETRSDTAAQPIPERYDELPVRPQRPLHAHPPPVRQHEAPTVATTRPLSEGDLYKSIKGLSHFLEDEMRTSAMLDPLLATGEALLRDLAYRVRAFKDAFAAWESLHITEGHALHRKQDVVQQLRAADLSAAARIDAIHTYDKFRFFINGFAARLFPWTTTYLGDHMSLHASFYSGGRGIVLTAGDNQAPYLLTSIPSFRKLGCKLPIEVLYLGDDDLDETWRERLEALPGVITRDITQMVEDKGWTLKGWAAKPFAILLSSFREAIFIDADALFLTNPELLFDEEQYKETGTLFFKDRNLLPESKKKWLRKILPSPISEHIKTNRLWTGESGHMQDSGVVVVDKWRHFIPLLLTTRLNGPDRDGDEATGKKGIYEMVYGDKETFWLSWELAGSLDYAFHDSVTGTMGTIGRPRRKLRKIQINSTKDHDAEDETDDADDDQHDKPRRKLVRFIASDHDTEDDADDNRDSQQDKPTICSSQLLHFNEHGRPFWFNGWIEKHKHDEDQPLDFADFRAYMKEPDEVGKRPRTSAWEIKTDNIVCLTQSEYHDFTEVESNVLDMIKDIARAREND